MFTGIVRTSVGRSARERAAGDARLRIAAQQLDLADGGSATASRAGLCLTVAARRGRGFAADVSKETLALTTSGARCRARGESRDGAACRRPPRRPHGLGPRRRRRHVLRERRSGDCCRLEIEVPASLRATSRARARSRWTA